MLKKLLYPSIVCIALFIFGVAPVNAATFSLSPSSQSIAVGQTATITVALDTQGAQTTAVDAVLNFDSNIVSINNVDFSTRPIFQPINFFKLTSSNSLEISSGFTDVASYFNGSENYTTITVTADTAGAATFTFDCTDGSTTDTNIAQRLTGADLVNCGSLNSAAITVTNDITPTPTPSSTPIGGDGGDGGNGGDGGDGGGDGGTTVAPPGTPSNFAAAAYSSNSILLTWTRVTGANYYSLRYGPAPGDYRWGAANIGNTDQFLVELLDPNTTYYFALSAVNDGGAGNSATTNGRTSAGQSYSWTPWVPSYTGGDKGGVGGVPVITPIPTPSPTPKPTIPSTTTMVTDYKSNTATDSVSRADEYTFKTAQPKEVKEDKGFFSSLKSILSRLIKPFLALFLILFFLLILMKRRKKDDEPPPTPPGATPVDSFSVKVK